MSVNYHKLVVHEAVAAVSKISEKDEDSDIAPCGITHIPPHAVSNWRRVLVRVIAFC